MKGIATLILVSLINTITMAKEIKTEILINASPEKVWSILMDFDKYPNWNPFIKSLEGEAKIKNKIKAVIQAPDSKPMTFKPRVISLVPNKEFSWLGHLIFPSIFDGKHKFEIINHGNGTCTFIQSEKFKGILVPLFKKHLNTNTKNGFELMNLKLKELAELRSIE